MVADWLATTKHPTLDRLYTELVYSPMVELLGYLRDNDYQTWIVSGGGVEFIRALSEPAYDIPLNQIVGSTIETEYSVIDATPSGLEIDNALKRLETLARGGGVVVGYSSALPASIDRISKWARAAQRRGIVLVPVSVAAVRARSS